MKCARFSLLTLLFALLTSSPFGERAFAHEGHDHAPGQVQAPHGGTIQKTAGYFAEAIGNAQEVRIYFFSPDVKPISAGEFKVTASVLFPKSKTRRKIILSAAGDHFTGAVNAAKIHRYELTVEIAFKQKREVLVYQIEPQG